jgi:hypothetical protein
MQVKPSQSETDLILATDSVVKQAIKKYISIVMWLGDYRLGLDL